VDTWTTAVKIEKSHWDLDLNTQVLTLGSCFADNLADFLTAHKFNVLANPFGTVYNLASIHRLLDYVIEEEQLSEYAFIQQDGGFFHYDFHSSFYAETKADLEKILMQQIASVRDFLDHTDVCILTLGTSFIYRLEENQQIVSNCHKKDQSLFRKCLLELSDQEKYFKEIFEKLKRFNPKLKIILSLSPVRHLKDGLIENSHSKSILRVLCSEMIKNFEHLSYFPAYELVLDELRDYRWFKEDRIHPSDEAVRYVLRAFISKYLNHETQDFIERWAKIKNSLSHRPFNVKSEKHQKFLRDLKQKIENFAEKIDVKEELHFIENQLF
jgi:hypothetical protein